MNPLDLIKTYTDKEFQETALDIFKFQAQYNGVYKEYLKKLGCKINQVTSIGEIPFLPITFFKNHDVITQNKPSQLTFLSSGTTQQNRSKHLVQDAQLYEKSFLKGFEYFFGDVKQYQILALLPNYLEQQNSSLVYMVDRLIKESQNPDSGFYLHNYQDLIQKLNFNEQTGQKTLLLGVSYALLDLIDLQKFQLKNTIVMETGGMKGRRPEMIRDELHQILKEGFGVHAIYSEYGMTELLSQGYSVGNGIFKPVPWMKILIREVEDPFHVLPNGKTGGINVIDFANYYSCSFIETQDLGKQNYDGSFEILGRFDHSDIRGCNLLIA